jgi:hypothetical protein
LKRLGSDIVASGDGEFRADASYALKFLYAVARSRLIRSELASCASEFLEKFLDLELRWPRTPLSVKGLCDHRAQRFLWMRYDEPRGKALFQHCENVLTDPEFRDVVKNVSTISGDKNERLRQLHSELQQLHHSTIRSIRSQGLFDDLITMQKDEFYKTHEQEIQDKFLNASRGGVLGLPPATMEQNENE